MFVLTGPLYLPYVESYGLSIEAPKAYFQTFLTVLAHAFLAGKISMS